MIAPRGKVGSHAGTWEVGEVEAAHGRRCYRREGTAAPSRAARTRRERADEDGRTRARAHCSRQPRALCGG
eukprot:3297515-Prymnesium_polylepis.1